MSEKAASEKAVPAFKWIPDTGFLVDGFKFAGPSVKAYFLSHAHSDHYTGITDNWNAGFIYCSPMTGRLIIHLLGVKAEFVRPLPMDVPQDIQGVEVTLVDANHCPGAVQFVFRLPCGKRYLHCGDMRFRPSLLDNPHLKRAQGCTGVFLDTTYCNPRYTFPPQEESVEYIAATLSGLLKQEDGKRRLFLISTYVIGKERVLLEVHKRTGMRIHVTEKKLGAMKCIDLPGVDIEEIFTTNEKETCIRVTPWGFLGDTWPFFRPNFTNMEQERAQSGVDEIVGFVPTGWMYEMKRTTFPVRQKGACKIHLVPYSEHSSYSELKEYVRFLRPAQVIPTVGVDKDESGKNAASQLKHFRNLIDETASKAKFLAGFQRSDSSAEAHKRAGLRSRSSSSTVPVAAPSDGGDQSSDEEAPNAGIKADPGQDEGQLQQEDTKSERDNQTHESLAGCDGSAAAGPSVKEEEEEQEQPVQPALVLTETDCPGIRHDAAPQQPVDEDAEPAISDVDMTPDQGDSVLDEDTAAALLKIASPRQQSATSENTGDSEAVRQLLGILGSEVSSMQAVQLLFKSRGDVARAVNAFYEPSPALPNGKGLSGGKKASSTIASSSAAKDAAKGQGSKRKATAAAAPAAAGSKRAKSAAKVGQRHITAFFGGASPVSTTQLAAVKPELPSARKQGASGTASLGASPKAATQLDAVMTQHAQALADGPEHLSSSAAEPGVPTDADAHAHTLTETASPEPQMQAQELTLAEAAANSNKPDTLQVMPAAAEDALQQLAGQDEQAAAPAQPGKRGISLPPAPLFAKQGSPSAHRKKQRQPQRVVTPSPSPGPADASPAAEPADSKAMDELKADQNNGKAPGKLKQETAASKPKDAPPDAVLKAVTEYDPVAMACWQRGSATPYLHIARALAAMDSTTKRLRISDALTNMFRSVLELSPEDLLATAYLVSGRIAPDYENLELKVGGATVGGAITEATGVTRSKLRDMFNKVGDLGDVAQACRHKQTTLAKPAPLTAGGVFATLRRMAGEKGSGSATRRQQAVLKLLRSCREKETQYLVRTLVQNLRVGAGWRSVVPALARASVLAREGRHASKARQDAAATAAGAAFHLCPSLDVLVPALLEEGVDGLERSCTLTQGVPLKPMLAKITEGIPDALRQMGTVPFLAEHKYDGQRAQIHLLAGGEVKVFSRNCEDRSPSFPDVAEAVRAAAAGGARSLVMDAELVAVDRANNNRLKAFQELSTRARGHISSHEVTVAVCVFAFDLLYVDGESLVHLPLRERRVRLQAALPQLQPGHVQLAHSVELVNNASPLLRPGVRSLPKPQGPAMALAEPVTAVLDQDDATSPPLSDSEEVVAEAATAMAAQIQEQLIEAFAAGTEGLMIKALEGPGAGYHPSKRSESWLKVKKDYCEDLRDSLDLVPIGAWHGNGRKVGWLSPFLLAAWDPDKEEFQSVCRCMSGFTDAFYQEATARLKARQLPGPKQYYSTGERPDLWFEPGEVWEIRGADLTISPVHMSAAGHLHPTRGVSMRFPRFIRIREDKRPEDASGPDVICELYRKQTRKMDTEPHAAGKGSKGRAAQPHARAHDEEDLEEQAPDTADLSENESSDIQPAGFASVQEMPEAL